MLQFNFSIVIFLITISTIPLIGADISLNEQINNLRSSDENLRHSAIIQLGLMTSQVDAAADALVDLLNDTDKNCTNAITALKNLGSGTIKVLEKKLIKDCLSLNSLAPEQDSAPCMRSISAIMELLTYFGKDSVEPCERMLLNELVMVRFTSIQVLNSLGSIAEHSIPMLQLRLHDSDMDVKQQAAAAIKSIKDDIIKKSIKKRP